MAIIKHKPSEFSSATKTALKESLLIRGIKWNIASYIQATQKQTSGILIIGHKYLIYDFKSGDDFINVGASLNASNQKFIAINTTPTVYSNGSTLIDITLSTPVITLLNDTEIDYKAIDSIEYHEPGDYRLKITDGFNDGKYFIFFSNPVFFDGSLFLYNGFKIDKDTIQINIKDVTNGECVDDTLGQYRTDVIYIGFLD